MLENEFEVEECDAGRLRIVPPGCDTLVLLNDGGNDCDSDALAAALSRLAGIERISVLVISPSSRLHDLSVLRALPALVTAGIHGRQIRSLEGISWFRSGRALDIDTGSNKRRDIGLLASTRIENLFLRYARPADLEAVGGAKALTHLKVLGSPAVPFGQWGSLPLRSLQLWGGAIEELADAERVPSLRVLTVDGCRKLRRFHGANGNVAEVIIQRCNGLDWNTIATLRNVEELWVTCVKPVIPISAFVPLRRLRSLYLAKVKVMLDVKGLKRSAPSLEKVVITGLPAPDLIELSVANPGVVVSGNTRTFRDGTRVEIE
jgi:hypothetical protein